MTEPARSQPRSGVWSERVQTLTPPSSPFVGGAYVNPVTPEAFDDYSPTLDARIVSVAGGGPADVDWAVRVARQAFEDGEWRHLRPGERKAILLRLADAIDTAADELALLDTLDMGRPISEARADVPATANVVRWYAEAIDKAYGETTRGGPGSLALVERQPLGVIGIVTPWNFPLSSAVWKIAPALAAGNTIVHKPATQSPLSALRLAELASRAGLPAGVLNVVPGTGAAVGRTLGEHPYVDAIAFTGSTSTGREFLRYSGGSNMKPVWIEGGGKSPNLVFADVADRDTAADAAMSAFFNQGEVCSANSLILVEDRIERDFVGRLVERARTLRPGDPLDPDTRLGALVDQRHTDEVMAAIAAGALQARLATGGTRVRVTSDCYITPAVFDRVEPDHLVAREEIFGPVVAVVPFSTEDEALRIVARSRYGLAASVWTADLSRAVRVASRLRAGTVSVNSVNAIDVTVPFGGFGDSGYGRDLSLHALEKYTGLKTTWITY